MCHLIKKNEMRALKILHGRIIMVTQTNLPTQNDKQHVEGNQSYVK